MTDPPAETALALRTEGSRHELALNMVKSLEVNDPSSLALASEYLADASATLAEREEQRKYLKAPALEQGRRIDALFAPVTGPLKEIVSTLRDKVATYHATEATARDSAAQAGMVPAAPPQRTELVTVTTKWTWGIADAAAIPREYLTPDADELGAHIRGAAPNEPPPIAGIRFVRAGKVRVGR